MHPDILTLLRFAVSAQVFRALLRASQTALALTHTHTHFHPLSWTAFFSPQSLPLSDLSSFFPHCVCFIWCQHIKVPNHQSKRVRDFFWGPSIQLRQAYARKATANHNVGWFLLLHRMKLSVLSSWETGNFRKSTKKQGKKNQRTNSNLQENPQSEHDYTKPSHLCSLSKG